MHHTKHKVKIATVTSLYQMYVRKKFNIEVLIPYCRSMLGLGGRVKTPFLQLSLILMSFNKATC